MRVGVLCMVMVCLSDRKITACSVNTTRTVSTKLSKVSVSCPSNDASSSELIYQLLFNGKCISRIRLPEAHDSRGSFSGQYEVIANNSGVYICKMEVIYPPPFKVSCHSTEVVVAEKQKTNDTSSEANQNCQVKSSLIPEVVLWAGCGALLLYSLTITCISIVLWRKLKNDEEEENVYVNTRPGELKKPCKA
ncbi:T-cell-specific surface glycoprotein CD28 homolog isoform X1 [Scomber japonicus]|uniref:T-cell-specific surface glycoprotein CD28 homolog isoform X1 n=1 Tax=Scomber japonicus TaxID=13676 RepID=UPI002305BE88|nr:T-cell-specific surface glycoprotein CD28 homolog isoform X1 [Scomber japonicus]